MVNVIMPAYNAHETIRQAIASVAVQDNKEDIQLTIVDDFSDEPYNYLLDDFKYLNINLLRKAFNSGCGQSRQYGIDHTDTDCEYFMFLDADDCFYTPDAVKTLLTVIKDGGYDMVISNFVEEIQGGQKLIHNNDPEWMHGKIYKTEYIKSYNIRFNETRTNEDGAYNTIIFNTEPKIYFIDFVSYLWKNNRCSLTRAKNFLDENIKDMPINAKYALSESMRLNASQDSLGYCVYQYLLSLYGYYLIFLYKNKNAKFLSKYLSDIKGFYNVIPNDLKEIPNIYVNKLFYNNSVIKIIIENNMIMPISFYDFLDLIKI